MNFKDLRAFLSFLDSKGELRHIKAPVSCELEITEIVDRVVASGGPALLFENVEGYNFPLVINLYGSHQRMAWALGVDHIDELTERVRQIIGMAQTPPSGIMSKLSTLGKLAGLARSQPKLVRSAPCQDVVLTGDDADVNMLPALMNNIKMIRATGSDGAVFVRYEKKID